MNTTTEPTREELELAHATGAAHALIALATARSKGITPSGDSDGAWVVLEYSPTPPWTPDGDSHDSGMYDAYNDAWYEVIVPALTYGEVGVRFETAPGESWRVEVTA